MEKDPLAKIRIKIDAIDDQIVDLLGKRFECVLQVAELKKKQGTTVYRPGREEAILKRVLERGVKLGLNPLLLQALFIQIFAVSRREQR